MGPLNLAQGRDAIRRMLGITPPADMNAGPPGAVPSDWPEPTNLVLNQCVGFAIQEINRQSEHHNTTSLCVPVAAQTAYGPFSVPLSTIVGTVGNIVNDIQRVSWHGGKDSILLVASSFTDLDRVNNQYDNAAPSTPQYYFVKEYSLCLTPAPDHAGTLHIYAGTGILAPLTDSDYIDQLPFDYQEIVWLGAAVKWLQTQCGAMDVAAMKAAMAQRQGG
jgi:hypothetical protein